MSKQIYFVVYYDTEDGSFTIDDERLMALAGSACTWDTETEEWVRPETDEELSVEADATYLLGETLGLHNGNAQRNFQTYFAEDGNYGDASSLAIVDTSDWTEEDWGRLDEESDWNRPETARLIAEEKRKNGTA